MPHEVAFEKMPLPQRKWHLSVSHSERTGTRWQVWMSATLANVRHDQCLPHPLSRPERPLPPAAEFRGGELTPYLGALPHWAPETSPIKHGSFHGGGEATTGKTTRARGGHQHRRTACTSLHSLQSGPPRSPFILPAARGQCFLPHSTPSNRGRAQSPGTKPGDPAHSTCHMGCLPRRPLPSPPLWGSTHLLGGNEDWEI